MIKKVLLLLFLLTLTTTFLQNCDCTEPREDNTKPGRRDYTWKLDSITTSGFPYIKSMWGSSPTDVWGAGFSPDVRDCLWHYDGISWKRAAIGTPITTSGSGSPIVGGVWGTAQDDVWAFGGRRFSNPERSEPFVMHFDGKEWKEFFGDKENMSHGFYDVYGIGKDDFWVTSAENVYHYFNGNWKKYFIGTNYIISSIHAYQNNLYVTTYPIPLELNVDTLFIMKFKNENFIIKDATSLFKGKFSHGGIALTDKKFYTFGDNGIMTAVMKNGDIAPNTWQTEINTNAYTGFGNSLMISSKDLWAVGSQYPYHYNGTDWQKITSIECPQNTRLFGIWGNGEEIFICDIENGKIYHGK